MFCRSFPSPNRLLGDVSGDTGVVFADPSILQDDRTKEMQEDEKRLAFCGKAVGLVGCPGARASLAPTS